MEDWPKFTLATLSQYVGIFLLQGIDRWLCGISDDDGISISLAIWLDEV